MAKTTKTDAMMKLLTEKLGRKPTAGEFKVYGRLIDGPKTAEEAKAGTRASLREMERAGLIEWRDELWHVVENVVHCRKGCDITFKDGDGRTAEERRADHEWKHRSEQVSLAEIRYAHQTIVGGKFPQTVPYNEVGAQLIRSHGRLFWDAVDTYRETTPPVVERGPESDHFRTVVLAVVATMDECIAHGIPCVASSIYLAVEEKGIDGMKLLAGMVTAGIVDGSVVGELRPGRNYEVVAEPVRQMLRKTH